MYKFKLKENSEFEVGDVKVKDGTKSTVTNINPVTGAISWDIINVGAFDTVYKTFDKLNKLLRTLESEGEAESDPTIDSITDQVKKLFNQYRTHVRKNYPEAYDRIRMVKEEEVNEGLFQKFVDNTVLGGILGMMWYTTIGTILDDTKTKLMADKIDSDPNLAKKLKTAIGIGGENLKEFLGTVYYMTFGNKNLEEEVDEGEDKKLPKGDIYLGRDDRGNHKIKSNGKVTLYNNEDMVLIYGKGWGHKLNEEEVDENKFYVTRNLGRGQGKGLVKKFDDKTFQTLDEPRTFDSYEEAETFVKRRMSGGASPGQMTAYWVSDENMNRIENVDEGEGMGYLTPRAFDKNKSSTGAKDIYYYKLGFKPVPKKIKGAGTIVKQLFEKEELTEYSDFQQNRINTFTDIEEKINSISPLLSNAKNETAQYYNENPGSYTIVYSTDMVNELLDDITKLLKQGE